RILAEPDNKNYGRLSIVLKYLFAVKAVKRVPPTSFFPRPKVESVFLAFTPKKERDIPFCKHYLERVVQIGFQHRRKKLRSQFKGAIVQKRILGHHLPELEKQFNLDERAEQWPLERWVALARFIESLPQDT
ncbi:hypothetical protein GF373_05370, partial [bacterium]|nr:hypothetical protein [bacterium]